MRQHNNVLSTIGRDDANSSKFCGKIRNTSTHHVTLNLQASNRPPREILEELATDVLPEFQTADES
jgi:hypothetical protein